MAYGENAGKSGVVYILREMSNHHKLGKRKTGLFKIGESTRSGKIRAEELTKEAQESGSNVFYEFITESSTQDCYTTEQLVFKKLEAFRLGSFGEWGGHELFEFTDDTQLQNAIKIICETCAEVNKNEFNKEKRNEAENQRQDSKNENLRRIIEDLETQRAYDSIQKRPAQEKTGCLHSIIRFFRVVFWFFTIGFLGSILFLIFFRPFSTPATYAKLEPATKPPKADYAQAPNFKNYPINTVYNGKIAPVILNTSDKKNYRTRLRASVTMPVDFAGEYVFVRWGCGMGCVDGAVVSHKTGHVVFLPASVCCWFGEEDLLQFQLDSRLLIANGSLNEGEEYGKFFYEFNGREFNLIHTQLLDREEAISKTNE